MSFWHKKKVLHVLRVAIEWFNALDNVTHKKVVLFPCNLDFVSCKCQSLGWQFVVNNFIEFCWVFEWQSQSFDYLLMKLEIQFLFMVIRKLPVNFTYSFYLQKFTKWCQSRSTQFSPLSNFPFHFWSKWHPYIFLTTGLKLLSIVRIASINVCMDGLSCLTSKLFDINRWGFDSSVVFNRNLLWGPFQSYEHPSQHQHLH